MKEIENFRREIDTIDIRIIDLLNKRAEIAKFIGEIKRRQNIEVSQPSREKEIIDRLKNKTTILKHYSIESIWKEIISACKVVQDTFVKVGYLGPQGTFTHQAAFTYFPKAGTKFIPCKNNLEVFNNIEKGNFEFGVIPIENSVQGTVRETMDLLIEKNIIIYGEIELRIIQNLTSLKESNISMIKNIYSHPQAFSQTRIWIKTNLPTAILINLNSTAEAVKKVKELNQKSNAAIGTEFACNLHDLKILYSRIEDNPINYTRFLIISKNENQIKSENTKTKTSIVFVTKHVPGALFKVLKLFADKNINLLKIESRPRRKGLWEYIFSMDFEGDKKDPKIKNMLDSLDQIVIWYKILGSYPSF